MSDDDKSLASQIKLPELLAALIGGGLLTPLVAVSYAHLAHHAAPAWLQGLLPALATSLGAGVVVIAARLGHYYATRKSRFTPAAKGDRLAVYVASFGNDKESLEAREDVFASIRGNFSIQYVEVLPAGVRYKLAEGVSEEQAALNATNAARALLAAKGGHLLIWGSVRNVDEKTRIELRFVTADPSSTPGDRKVYGLTDTLVLDPAFGPEMGAALAAIIASSASVAFENIGRYQKQILGPITARLKPFADNPPASMRVLDRATLLYSYGTMQIMLGEEASDPVRLGSAVSTFENALACLPRADAPWLWASLQNNLGNAIRDLGVIEFDADRDAGLARFGKATEAFKNALQEWTFETYPFDWGNGQNNLGNALANLGEKTGDVALLNQAAAAHREALRVRPRDTMPFDWAASQANLGDVSRMNAAIEPVPALRIALLRDAETATRNALQIYTAESYPLYSALVQFNLGVILTDLSELVPTEQRLPQARAALQSALNVFNTTSTFDASRTQKQLDRVDKLLSALPSNTR